MPKISRHPSYLPLIELWEQYLATAPNGDVAHFAVWVLDQKRKNETVPQTKEPLNTYIDQQTDIHEFPGYSPEAAIMLWRLSKFIRFYTRPVLLQNGLASQDDFAILAHVDHLKSCSKKEAIEANIIDPTTGIEIIRRLIKQGLLTERPNETDKRERLISLTGAGQKMLYNIFVGFSGIQDVMAHLNMAEREHLITVLRSLDDFHTKQHAQLLR